MQIGELFVRLSASTGNFDRSMRGAQASLTGFERRVKGLQGTMRALQANWFALTAGAAALGFGIDRVFRAADAFDASQRKLAATAKITGQSLEFLQNVSAGAQEGFRLSATTANEFAIEITKLTSKAGQLDKTSEALRAFIDLGAAKGLDATRTLQAIQQAILGIDEGTDKLFGKNPSVIYKEFADRVGLVASKMTDQQKAQALLSAALIDGQKVAGEYAEFLKSPAGAQALFAQRTEESARRVGTAWAGIRAAALPVLAALAEVFGKLVEFIPKGALIIARGIAFIPEYALKSVGKVLQGLGWLSEAFTKAVSDFTFGAVQLGSGLADGLRSQGDLLEQTGADLGELVGRNFTRLMAETSADIDLAKFSSNIEANVTSPLAEATEQAKKLFAQLGKLPSGNQGFGPLAITEQAERARPGAGPLDRGKLDLELKDGSITANTLQVLGDARNRSAPAPPSLLGRAGGALKDFGSNLGTQVEGLLSQFGPLAAAAAALRPVFEGLMETLGPVLSTLAEPLRTIGALLGTVIAPVLRLLAPPLNLLAKGVSYVVEAFGWLIEALGRFVDKIVPDWISKAGKGLAKMGQELQDGARDARRNMGKFTDGVDDFAESVDKASQSLVNYANVQHINALRFGIGAGMGTGSGVAGRPGGRPAPEVYVSVNVPADVIVEEGGKVIQRRASRGGTTRFALAT